MADRLHAVLDAARDLVRHANDTWDIGIHDHSSDPQWWDEWEDQREDYAEALRASLAALDGEDQ